MPNRFDTVVDVYIFESLADANNQDEERYAEVWREVPCVPRVGDTIFLRKDLGRRGRRPTRKVLAVEWFNARDEKSPIAKTAPTPLHAHVILETQLYSRFP